MGNPSKKPFHLFVFPPINPEDIYGSSKQIAITSFSQQLMHDKIMIFRGQHVVITGSYNFTISAQTRNQENVVIIRDEKIYKSYCAAFERLKDRSTEITMKNISDYKTMLFTQDQEEVRFRKKGKKI